MSAEAITWKEYPDDLPEITEKTPASDRAELPWQSILLHSAILLGLIAIYACGTAMAAATPSHKALVLWVNSMGLFFVSALAGVMAAWTIGGPGFFFFRMAQAAAVGSLIVQCGLMAQLTWQSEPATRNHLNSFTAGMVWSWLGLSYAGSLVGLAIAWLCGWRLYRSEEKTPPTSQYRLAELFAAMFCAIVACAVIGTGLSGDSYYRYEGAVNGGVLLLFLGAPLFISNITGLTCGLGSWLAVLLGGLCATCLWFIPCSLFVYGMPFSREPHFEFYVLMPAALTQFFAVVAGMKLMRTCLEA